jgi:hypothetical protein
VEGFFELRAILHNPAVNGGVIHVDATLEHQFFDMAGAQRIRHIPAHTHENDVLWKMGALEAHHPCSPSLDQSRFQRKIIPEIVYG